MDIQKIKKEYTNKIDLLDVDLIIAHVIQKSREFILAHPEFKIGKKQEKKINNFIKRRIKHEPLAYILGHKEFFGLDLKVNKNALVPRPETEILIEKVLQEKIKPNAVIIDIGTGSGNIIISLAKKIKQKNIKFFALDISRKALVVTRQNIKQHKLKNKIKVIHSDLLKNFLKSNKNKKVINNNNDLIIVANLPYLDLEWKNSLKSSDTKGLKFEPNIALYSGKDGLDAYRKLAQQIKNISPGNIKLFCEIGHLQSIGIKKAFNFAKKINLHKDLSGKTRVCEILI